MARPKRLPQPGTDQRDAWRRALADRGRQQHNRRGKRPGPQIVGVRIPPPSGSPRVPGDPLRKPEP